MRRVHATSDAQNVPLAPSPPHFLLELGAVGVEPGALGAICGAVGGEPGAVGVESGAVGGKTDAVGTAARATVGFET